MNRLLEGIELISGPMGPGPYQIPAPTMTVVVGPNGSGKSQLLREVYQYSTIGPRAGRKLLRSLLLRFPSGDEASKVLIGKSVPTPEGERPSEGHIFVPLMAPTKNDSAPEKVFLPMLTQEMDKTYNKQSLGQSVEDAWVGVYEFFSFFTVSLDGRTRFELTDSRPAGDILQSPRNLLAALFVDAVARKKVRELAEEAFGLSLVIDPTDLGTLRAKWSKSAPIDEAQEQGLDQRARAFHAAALDVNQVSDGVKAYTGLVGALVSWDFRIVVVDEPEAFLHPPLARKLGSRMTELAAEKDAAVLAATHSADFLMGCVESGKSVNVLRLTYDDGVGRSRMLPEAKLRELMKDPLLRSSGPLSALFHSAAVICEADADQAFYREVNWRLEAAHRAFVRDAVFLRVPGKAVLHRLVRPLRLMGIPTAAIVDIDILKGKDLNELCDACSVPEALKKGWAATRGDIEAKFKANGADMKQGGVDLLTSSDRQAAINLFDDLAKYGIFVVRHGELESWLNVLGAKGRKQEWLASVFELMGSDPNEPAYVRPGSGDVWEFLETISAWTSNSNRLGMPG